MPTIGTAGHVDHGKSTLVRALTGIDPDRLAEEQARGMTIDLGFAWMTLPNGQAVSIVDVPGHEDFIKNMLAGVGGIDLALLVVAADEGIMPQTTEHLAILDLLRVRRGVVALTKRDLVDDEWLALVRDEVAMALQPTSLVGAPIIPVSATTGAGLDDLIAALQAGLAPPLTPPHPADGEGNNTADGEGNNAADGEGNYTDGGAGNNTTDGEENNSETSKLISSRRAQRCPASSPSPSAGWGGGWGVGPLRLPIDRVFSIAGFGTVVTGTLLDGPLAVGAEVALFPDGPRARVRGIQQHKMAVTVAQPGTRVALNLAGVERATVRRGMVASLPGAFTPSKRLDVRLECARNAPRPIRHNARLDLFVGAAVVPVQVRLLAEDEILPGAQGWAQLEVRDPVVVARGDRFVVRNPSPSETLGGGSIVDTMPRQHRRHQPEVLARLAALASADPVEVVHETLRSWRPPGEHVSLAAVASLARFPTGVTQAALTTLQERGTILQIGEMYFATEQWEALGARSAAALAAYHARYPLRAGMPLEDWRTQAGAVPTVMARLQEAGHIALMTSGNSGHTPTVVRLPAFTPQFTPTQQAALDQALARLAAEPLNPLPASEMEAQVGREVLAAAVANGTLVRLNGDVVVLAATVVDLQARLVAYLTATERITVAEARDLLGGTRRVLVPLLEWFDARQVTRRVGDVRVLGLRRPSS